MRSASRAEPRSRTVWKRPCVSPARSGGRRTQRDLAKMGRKRKQNKEGRATGNVTEEGPHSPGAS